MIIGMDWLESFCPMQVHWKDKWLSIPYEGTSVVLQGDLADTPKALFLQVYALDQPTPPLEPVPLPAKVQALLE
jgi:hypothetical protein